MQIRDVTVSFKGTIPTQAYGSIAVEVQWIAELDEGESPEQATAELFQRIRHEVTLAVAPIAKAKLRQAQHLLGGLPVDRQKEITGAFGAVEWLSVVLPEAHFAEQNEGDTARNIQESIDAD